MMVMINKFHIGDRVSVLSTCSTCKQKGKVRKYISYPKKYNRKYVQVKLDNGNIRSYNEDSLCLIHS